MICGSYSENEEFDASNVFSSEGSLFFFYGEGFASDPLLEEADKKIVDGHESSVEETQLESARVGREDCGVICGTVEGASTWNCRFLKQKVSLEF